MNDEQRTIFDDESTIIARLRVDDESAFDAIYSAHVHGLVRFALSYVHSVATAQDVVADVYVRLWATRHTWAPTNGIRAYLYTAVRNRSLNALRDDGIAQRNEERMALESDLPGMSAPSDAVDERVAQADRISRLYQVIGTFKPARRRLILLRWRDGLTVEEIAGILQVSKNAVEQQLSRALRSLRDAVPESLR